MKKIIILLILTANCKQSQEFYHGYVYYNNKPVSNVFIKEDVLNSSKNTKTDSTGFFKLQKKPSHLSNLIFTKDGFKTDTIKTVWSQHGEKIRYTFLNTKFDTLVLRTSFK